MAFTPPPPYDPPTRTGGRSVSHNTVETHVLNSFSYKTVNTRWPVILTGVIDTVCNFNHELHVQAADEATANANADKIAQGRSIIEQISKLKYEMARDKELQTLYDDGEPHVELYNSQLEELKKEGKNTWYTAPWLFAECYLYRLLRNYFLAAKWTDYDPFFKQK
ncbi:hypothetical protein BD626DRAFT_407754, partial [Schizophyllum amplum]